MTTEDLTVYGPWNKDRVLGVGGFGIVTLWKNSENDKYLALKKCRWDNASLVGTEMVSKKQKERWSKEVEIMKRLSHRNVVQSIPLPNEFQSMKSELPILSMEFCSLGDLRQVLNKPENCCGLQEVEVRQIITDIKNAVSYLHSEKITHRDLKPENIVLQSDRDTPGGIIYKLIDLGYAKELDQSSICNSFVGTLQYLAPELYLNSVYTSSVDYWSLGLVSHEVITGVRPFLPNMPPTQWMMHVEKKKSDVICVYQRVDDNSIVFKKELFKENHISDYLRVQLEKWLMVALEWNPEKRGRVNSELTIFKMIDNIFSKKIILVFCAKLYKRFSYEVDSATAVSTLKTWIERDANQPVSQQLLLLPSGEKLTDDKFAISCWDPTIQDVMLYVLPTTGFTLPRDVSPYFPELVQFLLKNGKESVEFSMKRRIWANAVYFVYQELFLYQCFLDSYAVKMLWLVSFHFKLQAVLDELSEKFQNLRGTCNLAQQSLSCDQRYFQPLISTISRAAPQQKRFFTQYETTIMLHSGKFKQDLNRQYSLEETLHSVGQKVSNIKRRVTALQKFLEPSRTKLLEMKNALKGSYKSYLHLIASKKQEQFQHSMKSEKTEQAMKSNSFDMGRLIYNFLKVRDMALNDRDFISHLNEMNSCESELLTLDNQLQSLLLEIKASTDRIVNTHLKRQEELWAVVKKLSETQVTTAHSTAQVMPTSNDIQQPIINEDVLDTNNKQVISPEKSPSPSSSTRNQLQSHSNNDISRSVSCVDHLNAHEERPINTPTSNGTSLPYLMPDSMALSSSFNDLVLDEHLTLRCDLVEYMTQAHRTIQSIKDDCKSMDWKSLYDA